MASSSTIAIPYARAVFEIAQSEASLDKWSEQLSGLAEIAANADMEQVLGNPSVTRAQVAELVIDIADGLLGGKAINLVKVLADNERIAVLPEISKRFDELKTDAENKIEAEVVSAMPLNAEQRKNIQDGLKRRFGKNIELSEKEDPSLIGGAVIRAGDLVIDGSVKGKLAKLESVVTR